MAYPLPVDHLLAASARVARETEAELRGIREKQAETRRLIARTKETIRRTRALIERLNRLAQSWGADANATNHQTRRRDRIRRAR